MDGFFFHSLFLFFFLLFLFLSLFFIFYLVCRTLSLSLIFMTRKSRAGGLTLEEVFYVPIFSFFFCDTFGVEFLFFFFFFFRLLFLVPMSCTMIRSLFLPSGVFSLWGIFFFFVFG